MDNKGKFELIEGYEIEPDQLFRQEGMDAILSRIENYQAYKLPKLLQQNTKRLEDTVTALINKRFSSLQYMITQLQSRLDRLGLDNMRDEDTYSRKKQRSDYERRSQSQFEGGLVSRREESDDGFDAERSVISIDKTSYIEIIEPPQVMQNPEMLLARLQDRFKEMDLTFTKCQKIYEFPEMRQLNFHEKIDSINNIFFLAWLENSELIGAFTQQCFDPKPIPIPRQNPKAFLCNLDKEAFLYADRFNRTHTYDKNYLIFGNWEIKVKVGEDLLQTQWGKNGQIFLRKHFGSPEKTNIRLQWLFGNEAALRVLKIRRYHFYIFK